MSLPKYDGCLNVQPAVFHFILEHLALISLDGDHTATGDFMFFLIL